MRREITLFLAILGIGFVACGGEGSPTDGGSDSVTGDVRFDGLRPDGGSDTLPDLGTDSGDQLPAMGNLHVVAAPIIADVTCQIIVDNETVGSVNPGSDTTVALTAGSHDVKLVCPGNCGSDTRPCPGYGYVVAGYNFSSRSMPVTDWVMEGVQITAGATTEVNATICRDLTGRWQQVDGARNVRIETGTDNHCWSIGLSPWDYWVTADTVTVQYVGSCGGTTGQITDNGYLITVDCGGGNVLTYTRLD